MKSTLLIGNFFLSQRQNCRVHVLVFLSRRRCGVKSWPICPWLARKWRKNLIINKSSDVARVKNCLSADIKKNKVSSLHFLWPLLTQEQATSPRDIIKYHFMMPFNPFRNLSFSITENDKTNKKLFSLLSAFCTPILWASQPFRQHTALKTWWKSWTNCLHASIAWPRWVSNIQCEGQAWGEYKIDSRVKNTLSFFHKIFLCFLFSGQWESKVYWIVYGMSVANDCDSSSHRCI